MVTQRVVDAREDAPQGEASFDRIAEAVATLGRHEELVVLNATQVGLALSLDGRTRLHA